MTGIIDLFGRDGSALLGRDRRDVRASVMELVVGRMHRLDVSETIAIAKLVDSRIAVIAPDLSLDLAELALRAIGPIAPLAEDVSDLDDVVSAFCGLLGRHGTLRSIIRTAEEKMRFHLAMQAERERMPGCITPAMIRMVHDQNLVEDGSTSARMAGDHLSFRLIGPNVEIRHGTRYHHPEEMISYAVPIIARDDGGDRADAPEPNPMVEA